MYANETMKKITDDEGKHVKATRNGATRENMTRWSKLAVRGQRKVMKTAMPGWSERGHFHAHAPQRTPQGNLHVIGHYQIVVVARASRATEKSL
jgi:hypothetical protein